MFESIKIWDYYNSEYTRVSLTTEYTLGKSNNESKKYVKTKARFPVTILSTHTLVSPAVSMTWSRTSMLRLGCHYWGANLFVQTAVRHTLGGKSVCMACSNTHPGQQICLHGLQWDTPWVVNLSVWPAVIHTLGGKSVCMACSNTHPGWQICLYGLQ